MTKPMIMRDLASIVTMTFAALAPASAQHVSDLGPPPDWTRYKELAEAATRAKLPDPQNWTFEWPNGYANFGGRPGSRWHGWTTCGVLRAITPTRGQLAVTNFIVVVDHDEVRSVRISGRETNSSVNISCAAAVGRGILPPASLMISDPDLSAAGAMPIDRLGFSVRSTPEGAYVTAVVPATPAAFAGLQPGMVITRANGITLAGLGAATIEILTSDQLKFDIETATGEHLTLTPRPSGSATR